MVFFNKLGALLPFERGPSFLAIISFCEPDFFDIGPGCIKVLIVEAWDRVKSILPDPHPDLQLEPNRLRPICSGLIQSGSNPEIAFNPGFGPRLWENPAGSGPAPVTSVS